MTKGIINRFKVMDVSRGAVLTGHVVSTMVRTTLALAAIIAVAFLLGFSPTGSVLDWLAAGGVLLLVLLAVSWLTVAFGLAAKTQESAGFSTVPLIMLPFFSSAIVPADKMGAGVKEFAHYQPFTPIIESIRGFLIRSTEHRPDPGRDRLVARHRRRRLRLGQIELQQAGLTAHCLTPIGQRRSRIASMNPVSPRRCRAPGRGRLRYGWTVSLPW